MLKLKREPTVVIETTNRLFTKQVLCHLSYVGYTPLFCDLLDLADLGTNLTLLIFQRSLLSLSLS